MFVSYLSPVAPAAVLLLSAFILLLLVWLSPPGGQVRPFLQNYLVLLLVGVAGLSLFFIRLTLVADQAGSGLTELSSWSFSAETIAALTVRADEISLPFLFLTLLLLGVMSLMTAPMYRSPEALPENDHLSQPSRWRVAAGWLLVGASAALLFVSANILTINYSLLIFDILLAGYWLRQRNPDLAVARLFLGVLTVTGLSLNGAERLAGGTNLAQGAGSLLVAGVLWLRLALFPWLELAAPFRPAGPASRSRVWVDDDERLVYGGLSLLVGIFLVGRVVATELPDLFLGLTIVAMGLSGLLAWLSERYPVGLIYLILTETLLLLLVAPASGEVVIATTLTLLLGLVALWVTPRLGRPSLEERAWLWPYLPALLATLSLLGLPLSLGWLMRTTFYDTLFAAGNLTIMIGAGLAEMLALSSLVRYWVTLWQGKNGPGVRLTVAVMVVVPFLVPGLAPFVLSRVTRSELLTGPLTHLPAVLTMTVVVTGGAFLLNFYRAAILARWRISAETLTKLAQLRWLWIWGGRWLRQIGNFLLRLDLVLEGQHYLGWAIAAALVGLLVILLQT
jgi:hypothetical protein